MLIRKIDSYGKNIWCLFNKVGIQSTIKEKWKEWERNKCGWWHKCVPLKDTIFAWQSLQNWIPTKDHLISRGIIASEEVWCISDYSYRESLKHLFF